MHPALRYPYKVIDRLAPLRLLSERLLATAASSSTSSLATSSSSSSSSVGKLPEPVIDLSVDIEALVHPLQANQPKHLGEISLIQLCSTTPSKRQEGEEQQQQEGEEEENVVSVIDVLSLGRENVKQVLGPVIESTLIRKIMFDCRRDVEAFSSQLQLRPRRVLDLQLAHVGSQWKSRASDRRSGLQYVLKQELGIDRQAGDAAVSKAMLFGNRPVWDVRPLPDHFLEYAADDVRHVCALFDTMKIRHASLMDATERISEEYTEFYAQGKPVEEEADSKSHNVRNSWLERYFGPAGICAFCGVRGHHQDQCFKKGIANNNNNTSSSSSSSSDVSGLKQQQTASTSTSTSSSGSVKTSGGVMRCSYCNALGHIATNCFKKHPQLLKCSACGQHGHNEKNCFVLNPCKYCGGKHKSEKCLKRKMIEAENADAASASSAGS